MESESSGIFGVKLVANKIVLGSPGTHFMHMKVKIHLNRGSSFIIVYCILTHIICTQGCERSCPANNFA